MCCIFTCCGWLIDLVQRLWTFTMSCCISSSVCCLLSVGSMSGIALGYNYSLAEYMDLKETNVSVYLKRGVFDDELTELDWRRAGHKPVRAYDPNAGLRGIENAVDMLEADGTTVRAARRLDDSLVDLGDQHRYEGSLFKLTAKPPVQNTEKPLVTAMTDLNKAAMWPRGSLESLKAIQSAIDARKAMAMQYAGQSTVSPVPTYPFQEAEYVYPGMMSGRRAMEGGPPVIPSVNPARLAVPDQSIGNKANWMVAKHPDIPFMNRKELLELHPFKPEDLSTYPSPITMRTGPIRPTPTASTIPDADNHIFITRTKLFTLFSTASTDLERPLPDRHPTAETIKEKLAKMAYDQPIRKNKPKPEEEYDYDIKGLPVRKRRSVDLNESSQEQKGSLLQDKENKVINQAFNSVDNVDDDAINPMSVKEFLDSYISDIIKTNKQDKISVKEINNVDDIDVSKHHTYILNQPVLKETDTEYKSQSAMQEVSETRNALVARLITKVKSFFDLTSSDNLNIASIETKNESKDTEKMQNNGVSEIVFTEKDANSINTASVEPSAFDDHKTSDNILNFGYNEKDIIKSTSSVFVNMLLSTIT